MARKIAWTLTAWNDLEAVVDYIAKDSPHYAAALIHEVKEAANSLSLVFSIYNSNFQYFSREK